MAAAPGGQPKPFLDLRDVVLRWAWSKYDDKPTKKQKSLRDKEQKKKKSYIGKDIDWSDCKFVHGEPTWPEKLADTKKDAATASPARGRDVSILFETEFTNNTNTEQTYTMKIDKTTTSVCSTEVSKGVTKGVEMSVGLKLPNEILEMNAGFKREVTLTDTSGESFEEQLSWGAESEIKVEKGHVAYASLIVKEHRKEGSFRMITTVRGTVTVSFTDLKDNNASLKEATGDIGYIVQKYMDKQRRLDVFYPHVKVHEDGDVTIETEGSCKFRYGIKQEVIVNQKKL